MISPEILIPSKFILLFPAVSSFFDVCFQIAARRVSRSSSFSFLPSGFHVKASHAMMLTSLRRV